VTLVATFRNVAGVKFAERPATASGVQSPQVAAWAGHSVAVLHEVYAKVLAGLEEESLEKIAHILGLPSDDEDEEDRE
jgi:hypothetical protein